MRGAQVLVVAAWLAGCGVEKLSGDSAAVDTADNGSDGGADTGPQVFPDEAASLSVLIDGGAWGCAPQEGGDLGYFTSTSVYCQKETGGSTYETVTLTVDGDLAVYGRYPVTGFSYSLQVAQETPTIYDAQDPGDLAVQVLGYGETGYEDAATLFAESEGSGTFDNGMEFSGLVLEGWPGL